MATGIGEFERRALDGVLDLHQWARDQERTLAARAAQRVLGGIAVPEADIAHVIGHMAQGSWSAALTRIIEVVARDTAKRVAVLHDAAKDSAARAERASVAQSD